MWPPSIGSAGQAEVGQALAEHEPARHLRQRHADRLGDERDGPRRAGVGLDDVQPPGVDRVLDVEQAHHPEAERDAAGVAPDLLEHRVPERVRGQHAGRVARVDPGLLDVLHDPADPHVLAVAERVDVDLDRVLQEPVEEDRPSVAGVAGQVVGQPVGRVDDLHRPAAEDVARAHEQGEADLVAGLERLADRVRRRVRRGLEAQALQERAEATAVLGQVDGVDARAEQRHARLREARRELERRLAPELDDDALGPLLLHHREDVLERQRLEVEAVGRVVVRGDRLGVAVDHHRVAARGPDGHGRMDAAVVELDALSDAVGARAEDDDARAVRALHLGDAVRSQAE
jgi:hypothetical protein